MTPKRIDLNSADVKELTQLPGIAKNTAYDIVNHRNRHGYFTAWEELESVRGFPVEKLDDIKERAVLGHPEGVEHHAPPRHLQAAHVVEITRKPAGYTRKLRTDRRTEKMHNNRSRRAG